MPAFSASGTAGVVPTKIWMSYVADKYTMLSPYDDANNFLNTSATTLIACTLTNKFNAKSASFGAFTTAPDGTTNTAQKIVEDNTNSQHTVQAGMQFPLFIAPTLRFAGIFKALERTRVAARVSDGNSIADYVYAGFDLAGGQIAYGAQNNGSGSSRFTITNQAIYPVGTGFYLCFIDFQPLSGTAPPASYRWVLDNGTGTGAPSISYAGDGASGLYGWKTSVLPAQAWSITSQCFFDDFNDPTMANIDLNATFDPTKKWFVQQDFRNALNTWLHTIPIPPGSLSVSGSILHIPPSPISPGSSGNEGPGVSTFGNASSRNPLPGVGQGWRPPFMFETKMAFDYPNTVLGGDGSFWGGYVEYANAVAANAVSQSGAVNGGEMDFCETGFQVNQSGGQTAGFFYDSIIGGQGGLVSTFLGVQSNIGFPPFQTSYVGNYGNGIVVGSGGNFYKSTEASNPDTPPAGHWTSYTYPGALSGTAHDPMILTDPSQQHVYTEICVPFNRVTKDGGCFLHFYDGVYRGMPCAWAPSANLSLENNNPYMHTTDWMQFFIMIMAGTGYSMSVDSVRVSQ